MQVENNALEIVTGIVATCEKVLSGKFIHYDSGAFPVFGSADISDLNWNRRCAVAPLDGTAGYGLRVSANRTMPEEDGDEAAGAFSTFDAEMQDGKIIRAHAAPNYSYSNRGGDGRHTNIIFEPDFVRPNGYRGCRLNGIPTDDPDFCRRLNLAVLDTVSKLRTMAEAEALQKLRETEKRWRKMNR